MQIEIVVPQIGEAVSELTIVEWYKKEGDYIRKGDPLFSVDADKSVVEVESFTDGVLEKIVVRAGDTVYPNQVVALVKSEQETGKTSVSPTRDEWTVSGALLVKETSDDIQDIRTGEDHRNRPRTFISPRAKKLLNQRGIPLDELKVRGTGVRGIITEKDVVAYLSELMESASKSPQSAAESQAVEAHIQREETEASSVFHLKKVEEMITIKTEKKTQVLNVTSLIVPLVEKVKEGIVIVSIPHTTAALFLAEDDLQLRDDFIKIAENWLKELRPFTHVKSNNPNTEAHVLSALFGSQLVLVIKEGRLDIGKYQNLLFLEMDGPKERQIKIKII